MVDEHAPSGTFRSIYGREWRDVRGTESEHVVRQAAATIGRSEDTCYILAAHLGEGAVYLDVAVPTDRQSSADLQLVHGDCRYVDLLFRRFKVGT